MRNGKIRIFIKNSAGKIFDEKICASVAVFQKVGISGNAEAGAVYLIHQILVAKFEDVAVKIALRHRKKKPSEVVYCYDFRAGKPCRNFKKIFLVSVFGMAGKQIFHKKGFEVAFSVKVFRNLCGVFVAERKKERNGFASGSGGIFRNGLFGNSGGENKIPSGFYFIKMSFFRDKISFERLKIHWTCDIPEKIRGIAVSQINKNAAENVLSGV